MALDLTKLSIEELQALAAQAQAQANTLAAQKQLEELEESEARKERTANAVASLTALLGPEDAPPYVPGGEAPPSIRGLLAYPPEILAENAGIALQMLYQGLEALTITTRDLAGIISVND